MDPVIQVPAPESVNLSPIGFYLWAEDFLTAARAYAPSARPTSFVAHFLCCQSVELSLKAFLLLKGGTLGELKRMGHNLSALFTKACHEGLGNLVPFNGGDESILQAADVWYCDGRRFQYFDVRVLTRFRSAPDLADLEELATRLQSSPLRDAVENFR